MDEMIKLKDGAYARYEELLMQRDTLRKEAFARDREYVRVFGKRILRNFELKLSCIRKKKTIAFCQAAANCGKAVDRKELEEYLKREMAQYQEQLKAMAEDHEKARKVERISEFELLNIRKIYRRLAKRLHPDINPKVSESEALRELWERISAAYRCNDLEELKELEVLAEAAIRSLGEEGADIDVPDISRKITEVEEEMERIRTTDPYLYKQILNDPEAVREKEKELDEEYDSYVLYEKQLEDILQTLLANEVIITWRMN